jgi:hypothetical protein
MHVPTEKNDTGSLLKKDDGTTKDAFKFLNKQVQVHLPTQGARSIILQALSILNRVWKNKMISPVLKTFTWKLLRRAPA